MSIKSFLKGLSGKKNQITDLADFAQDNGISRNFSTALKETGVLKKSKGGWWRIRKSKRKDVMKDGFMSDLADLNNEITNKR